MTKKEKRAMIDALIAQAMAKPDFDPSYNAMPVYAVVPRKEKTVPRSGRRIWGEIRSNQVGGR